MIKNSKVKANDLNKCIERSSYRPSLSSEISCSKVEVVETASEFNV